MSFEKSKEWVGQIVGIATSHGKELQIGPILSNAFGFSWIVPAPMDTDALGAFSGERPRLGNPVDVARQKIALGRQLRPDITFWVASEGSFGPHPTIGFLPSDEEWLVFQNDEQAWEVSARVVSLSTNYQSGWFSTWENLWQFAQSIGFPSHGLILRPSETELSPMRKGIQDEATLFAEFHSYLSQFGGVYALTDMRAMMNPTRQAVIQEAAHVLVKQLQSGCPNCLIPGYSIRHTTAGLPCSWCGLPTRSALEAVWSCSHCQFSTTQRFPHGRQEEDPGLCDYCNP